MEVVCTVFGQYLENVRRGPIPVWMLCCVISLEFKEGVVWKVSGKGPQDIRWISKGCHEEGFLRLFEWCLEDVEKNSKWYLL